MNILAWLKRWLLPPGTIEFWRGNAGYQFHYRGANGEIVAFSNQGYENRADCLQTLDRYFYGVPRRELQ